MRNNPTHYDSLTRFVPRQFAVDAPVLERNGAPPRIWPSLER
jgi:hypothetical protein